MRHALTALSVIAFVSQAGADPIKVNANVGGKATQIGELNVTVGKDKQADHLQGTFTFGKDQGVLDASYDFRWINVVVEASLKGKKLKKVSQLGDLAAIDPAPSDNPKPGDGPAPYYYNAPEWNSKKFGSIDIRKDGEFSRFSDSPDGHSFDKVTFWNFLVVEGVGKTKWDPKTFCVLAGYSWEYMSGTKWNPITEDYDDDVSAFGKELSVKDSLKTINVALANASVGGDFKGWKAVLDCNLTHVPTPGTLALLTLSGLVAIRRRQ